MRRTTTAIAATALAATLLAPLAPAAAAPADTQLAPGDPIVISNGQGGTNTCTVGFIDASRAIAYTAGHCATDGKHQATTRSGTLLGYTYPDASRPEAPTQTIDDARGLAAVALVPGIATTNTLPNGTKLTGMAIAANRVNPGDRACFYGAKTAATECGTVLTVNDKTIITTIPSQQGDSGGPAYLDDGTLIGLMVRIRTSTGQSALSPAWDIHQTLKDKGLDT